MEEYFGQMISLPMVPLGAIVKSITQEDPFEGRDVIKIEFSSNNGSSMFYFKDEFIKNVRIIQQNQGKGPDLVNQLEVDNGDIIINKNTGKEWTVGQVFKNTAYITSDNTTVRIILTKDKWEFKK